MITRNLLESYREICKTVGLIRVWLAGHGL